MSSTADTVVSSTLANGPLATTELVNFEQLYPAVLQCFILIAAGYLAGRFKLISGKESLGLRNFVVYFLTPALIFKSMLELHFVNVNWKFLSCILCAKVTVFLCVAAVTLAISRNVGKAGIYGIFATQSNDLALGVLIVDALYSRTQPELVKYLYLFIPISLVIINPMGFLLMEIQKSRDTMVKSEHRKRTMLLHAFLTIFKNPVVLFSALGLIGNVILHAADREPPQLLIRVLEPFAVAFVPTALFCLGGSLLGCFQANSLVYVTPTVLVLSKILLLPLVTQEYMELFGITRATSYSLRTFGFLYATFPTAPTVYVYAAYYGFAVDKIATALALCTCASVPWTLLSARMITLTTITLESYVSTLSHASVNVAALSFGAAMWTFIVLLTSRQARQFAKLFVLCIAFSSVLATTNSLLLQVRMPVFLQGFCFMAKWTGLYATWCWGALLSLALVASKLFPTALGAVARRPLFCVCAVIGYGVPLIAAAIVSAAAQDYALVLQPDRHVEAVVTAILLFVGVIISVASLIIHQWPTRISAKEHGNIVRPYTGGNNREKSIKNQGQNRSLLAGGSSDEEKSIENQENQSKIAEESDNSDLQEDGKSDEKINEETTQDGSWIIAKKHDDMHFHLKYVVLVIFCCISMVVSLFVHSWQLVNKSTQSGIWMQLKLLDIVLSYGQGCFVFLLFGFDGSFIITPMLKRWRLMWHGTEKLVLPKKEDLDGPTRTVCEQFTTYHMTRFLDDLRRARRSANDLVLSQKNWFFGVELVNWLLAVGLIHDRAEGVKYGRRLVLGRLIEHVKQEEQFYDSQEFQYRVLGDASLMGVCSSKDDIQC